MVGCASRVHAHHESVHGILTREIRDTAKPVLSNESTPTSPPSRSWVWSRYRLCAYPEKFFFTICAFACWRVSVALLTKVACSLTLHAGAAVSLLLFRQAPSMCSGRDCNRTYIAVHTHPRASLLALSNISMIQPKSYDRSTA